MSEIPAILKGTVEARLIDRLIVRVVDGKVQKYVFGLAPFRPVRHEDIVTYARALVRQAGLDPDELEWSIDLPEDLEPEDSSDVV